MLKIISGDFNHKKNILNEENRIQNIEFTYQRIQQDGKIR